jgi:hypothetical protein
MERSATAVLRSSCVAMLAVGANGAPIAQITSV